MLIGFASWLAKRIRMCGTKTGAADRHVPLLPALEAVLLRSRQSSGYVVGEWGNVRRDLHAACGGRRANIPPCSPNDLRRTFASWLKQDGVDGAIVARLLGHSSTRMVDLVYGQIDTATLARALLRLPGGECELGGKDASGRAAQNGQPAQPPTLDNSLSSVLGVGIEPTTRGFSVRCSTN